MEDKVKFETGRAVEYAFEIVDERIRTVIKSMWSRDFRIRNAPQWVHRHVAKEHQGNGDFTVRVKGTFRAKRRERTFNFDCDMVVRLEKRHGCHSFRDVDGGFQQQ